MTEGADIRVLVVDDHHLFRQGLRSLLEEHGFDVVGEAVSGDHALAVARELRPDVVVMDLHMPGISGVEATSRMRAEGLGASVLVLTVSAADEDVVDAMQAGAAGYLLKDSAPHQIAAGIRAAVAGDSMLSPEVTSRLLKRMQPVRSAEKDVVEFSQRELEVVRLIAEGLDNAEIAERLVISPATAKNHVSSILAKTGAQSRLQAAVYALRHGLA